jgi:hypothetical protein
MFKLIYIWNMFSANLCYFSRYRDIDILENSHITFRRTRKSGCGKTLWSMTGKTVVSAGLYDGTFLFGVATRLAVGGLEFLQQNSTQAT